MTIALSIFAGIGGLLLLCLWSGRRARQQHALLTRQDVVAALAEATDNEARHDRWDDFLSWPITDAYLESVRQRALQIAHASAEEPGRDLSVAATKQLQALLSEVRARA